MRICQVANCLDTKKTLIFFYCSTETNKHIENILGLDSRLDKFATGQFATFADFHFGHFATFTLVDSRLLFGTIWEFFVANRQK